MFHDEPIFTTPSNDGTELKTDDVERIVPYSSSPLQTP